MNGDDPDDLAAWENLTRQIKPMTGKNRVMPEPKKPSRRIVPRDEVTFRPQAPETGAGPLPQKQVRKLRRQQIPVEARLDLHGMTVARAHERVDEFLRQALRNRLRCLEIITGRGDLTRGGGELRRSLPLWLETPWIKNSILHIEPNPVSRGGSFLVMLRRTKTDN